MQVDRLGPRAIGACGCDTMARLFERDAVRDKGLPIVLNTLKEEGSSAGIAANCVGEFGTRANKAKPDLLHLVENGDP